MDQSLGQISAGDVMISGVLGVLVLQGLLIRVVCARTQGA